MPQVWRFQSRSRTCKDAGGNRTHFDRVAAGCLAVWLQRQEYPRQESNLIPDLRRVVCDPPHPEDRSIPARTRTGIRTLGKSDVVRYTTRTNKRADGWIRASMRRFTGPLPFSIEPRRQRAGAQGFEPCGAALETACSPRSTLLNGIRLSAFGHRPPRAGTRRPKADRWPTPDRTGCPRGVEPATSTVTASHADRYTTNTIHQTAFGYRHSASKAAESRWSKADSRPITPRPGLEPGTPRSKRGMISVSPSGPKRKARESNPHLQWRTALAERPGQPYPATFQEESDSPVRKPGKTLKLLADS